MKRFVQTHVTACLALLFTCGALLAADATGKWTWKVQQGKKDMKKEVEMMVDLKADGGKLTGTFTGAGKKAQPTAIEEGKIDGDKISFKVSRDGKDGAKTVSEFSGKVDGDMIKGSVVNDVSKGKSADWNARRVK